MGFLAVFFGGGLGSLSRFLLSKLINENANTLFPVGTLIVNIAGCFIIGFAFSLFEKFVVPSEIRLLLITGFLGGFTTFSSFGLETINLIKGNELVSAVLNVLASIILGLLFVVLGMLLASVLFRKR
jgi:CrcB protein